MLRSNSQPGAANPLRPAPSPSPTSPSPALAFEPLCAVFRRTLKSEGLKYTPERARILESVLRMADVFQAEQLLDALRSGGQRVSKATVYRTIKLLQQAGIIQQVLFDAEQAHYQLAYGRRPTGLLVRLDTRQVVSLEVPELVAIRDRVCGSMGLTPRGHRLVIYAEGPDPAHDNPPMPPTPFAPTRPPSPPPTTAR